MNDLKIDILPEAAKIELLSFYEYLIYKYLKNLETLKCTDTEGDENLTAFYRFKKLRKRINPVVDKNINIDKLINEVNSHIF